MITQNCWTRPMSNAVRNIGVSNRQFSPGPSLAGTWNCATVSFSVPIAWATAGSSATIRLWARIQQTRWLVYSTNLETLNGNGGGQIIGAGAARKFVGLACAVSGLAVDAWEVDILGNSATSITDGVVALYAWGDSSAPFFISGQALNDAMANPAPPSVGSHNLVYVPSSSTWVRQLGYANGTVITSPPYQNIAFSTALEASHVITPVPGLLFSITGMIDSTFAAGTYYVQVFNLAAAPVDGTGTANWICGPRKIQHVVGVDDYFQFDFGLGGYGLSTGATVVLSTTRFTKTAAGAGMAIEGGNFL